MDSYPIKNTLFTVKVNKHVKQISVVVMDPNFKTYRNILKFDYKDIFIRENIILFNISKFDYIPIPANIDYIPANIDYIYISEDGIQKFKALDYIVNLHSYDTENYAFDTQERCYLFEENVILPLLNTGIDCNPYLVYKYYGLRLTSGIEDKTPPKISMMNISNYYLNGKKTSLILDKFVETSTDQSYVIINNEKIELTKELFLKLKNDAQDFSFGGKTIGLEMTNVYY